MSEQKKNIIPEGIKKELENSDIPLAVYRFANGHLETILVSNGLVRWQKPGCTREDLMHFLDTDMYKDVHHEDIVYVANKAKEFAKIKGRALRGYLPSKTVWERGIPYHPFRRLSPFFG